MSGRFKYLEDGNGLPASELPRPLDEDIRYPVLARYDFSGTGPRAGVDMDVRMYKLAAELKTRGELLAPRIVRIGWILLRLAVVVFILFVLLRGQEFSCFGRIISFE